jgi:hypothetical protein
VYLFFSAVSVVMPSVSVVVCCVPYSTVAPSMGSPCES